MANDNKLVTLEDLGEAYTALYNRDVVTAATQQANGLMSSTDKTKLDGIETGAQVNTITGVKGNAENDYRTGNVNITPDNVGALNKDFSTYTIAQTPYNGNELIPMRLGNDNIVTDINTFAGALTALGAVPKTDLTSIVATGTTNATGATIAKGTFFYLDGTLVQAKADIASGATFTSGTNYSAVTAGGLNALQSQKLSTVGEWWPRTNWLTSAEQGTLYVSYDANTITITFSTASRVHLENDVLFTIPNEFVPKIVLYPLVYVSGGSFTVLQIETNGSAHLWVNAGSGNTFLRGTVTYLYNVK